MECVIKTPEHPPFDRAIMVRQALGGVTDTAELLSRLSFPLDARKISLFVNPLSSFCGVSGFKELKK